MVHSAPSGPANPHSLVVTASNAATPSMHGRAELEVRVTAAGRCTVRWEHLAGKGLGLPLFRLLRGMLRQNNIAVVDVHAGYRDGARFWLERGAVLRDPPGRLVQAALVGAPTELMRDPTGEPEARQFLRNLSEQLCLWTPLRLEHDPHWQVMHGRRPWKASRRVERAIQKYAPLPQWFLVQPYGTETLSSAQYDCTLAL